MKIIQNSKYERNLYQIKLDTRLPKQVYFGTHDGGSRVKFQAHEVPAEVRNKFEDKFDAYYLSFEEIEDARVVSSSIVKDIHNNHVRLLLQHHFSRYEKLKFLDIDSKSFEVWVPWRYLWQTNYSRYCIKIKKFSNDCVHFFIAYREKVTPNSTYFDSIQYTIDKRRVVPLAEHRSIEDLKIYNIHQTDGYLEKKITISIRDRFLYRFLLSFHNSYAKEKSFYNKYVTNHNNPRENIQDGLPLKVKSLLLPWLVLLVLDRLIRQIFSSKSIQCKPITYLLKHGVYRKERWSAEYTLIYHPKSKKLAQSVNQCLKARVTKPLANIGQANWTNRYENNNNEFGISADDKSLTQVQDILLSLQHTYPATKCVFLVEYDKESAMKQDFESYLFNDGYQIFTIDKKYTYTKNQTLKTRMLI